MRFLLDEGLPFRLAAFLADEGHDIVACGRDFRHALTDREILAIAYGEQRIVLTNDKDFGDLVFRDRLPHAASSCSGSATCQSRTGSRGCTKP